MQTFLLETGRALIAVATLGLIGCGESSPPATDPSPPSDELAEERSEPAPPVAELPSGALRVAMRCISGPIPARPGDRPVRARRLEVRDRQVRRIVEHIDGPIFVRSSELSEEEHRQIADESAAAVARGEVPAEPRVPDGTWCVTEIEVGGRQVRLELALPASAPNPLRDRLIRMLPEATRPEGRSDAELEPSDRRCRDEAAIADADRRSWDLEEIRVDEQDRVFFYYVKPPSDDAVASSADHFGCRVEGDDLLLLPEG